MLKHGANSQHHSNSLQIDKFDICARIMRARNEFNNISLCYGPASCIDSGDWQRSGWPVPPQDMRFTWAQTMSYARRFRSCCTLVCSCRSHLASAIRVAADVPPLLLYPAPAAAADYLPRLTHAQLQLLLCGAGHACHFVRVMMPRDVRHNRDPRKQLLLRLFAEAVAQRLFRQTIHCKS